MANPNIGMETITKGVQLTVVVEYSFENVIAVLLVHNSKQYRGVLFQCDEGFFPHVFSKDQSTVNITVVERHDSANALPVSSVCNGIHSSEQNNSGQQASALVQRFSYNTNPFLVNPRPVPETPTIEMKPVGPRKKTVRDIRLRPRQTMCSVCKIAIHDNHKMTRPSHSLEPLKLIPASKSPLKHGLNTCSRSITPQSSLRHGLRKRKTSLQSPMVLLEDIHQKWIGPSSEKKAKANSVSRTHSQYQGGTDNGLRNNLQSQLAGRSALPGNPKVRSANRSSSLGSINHGSSSVVHNNRLQVTDDTNSNVKGGRNYPKSPRKERCMSNPGVAKPSPAIRINIGDGAILKIPPRLPDADNEAVKVDNYDPSVGPNEVIQSSGHQGHKKSKKAAKKSKDREKGKAAKDEESIGEIKTNGAIISKNGKKHKKKHRHKYDSPAHLSPNSNEKNESVVNNSIPVSVTCVGSVLSKPEADTLTEEICTKNELNETHTRNEEDHENNLPLKDPVDQSRPRLVYTWRQNKGLSRVAPSPKRLSPSHMSPAYYIKSSPGIIPVGNSPHRRKNASPARVMSASPNWPFTNSPGRMLKDYPLRSKSSGVFTPTYGSDQVPLGEHLLVHTSDDNQSNSSGMGSHLSDFIEEYGGDRSSDDFFEGGSPTIQDEDNGGSSCIKPLMLKIQTQNVTGCIVEEGREIRVGDIVWGKIQGFPWWPGRVSTITVTQRDNDVVITQLANVAWFGSNTMSHVHCAELFPFIEDFKARYNKKKKGQYRIAIKQATLAAQRIVAETDHDHVFEDYNF